MIVNKRNIWRETRVNTDWLIKVKELIKDVMEKKEDEIVLRREIYKQCEYVIEALIEYHPFPIKLLLPDLDNGELT
ncbi:MAG: hypothetical protein ACFFCI_22660 [Promethearchaeota archaeon]